MGVFRMGGGCHGAPPMSRRLPQKPSLLSAAIEALSLPLEQTGGQLTSWWCGKAGLHGRTDTDYHMELDKNNVMMK